MPVPEPLTRVEQGNIELAFMLRAGDRALENYLAAGQRAGVASFTTTLREALRVLRSAKVKLPKS